jgi:2TM domain
MAKEPNYEREIRQRITKRYENRSEFYGHLVGYLVFNGVLWGVFHPSGTGYTISLLISGLWGMGLAIHFIQFVMKEARENAIEKAIERERQWRSTYNPPEADMKRKRDRLTGLTDDGELYEIVEDDSEDGRYEQG